MVIQSIGMEQKDRRDDINTCSVFAVQVFSYSNMYIFTKWAT